MMTDRDPQAQVFTLEVRDPPAGHTFQQYHAFAVIGARASHEQCKAKYRKLTLPFCAIGHLLSEGCVRQD